MREGPLPADVQATAKLVRLRSCAADVESVLREFFDLTDEGWRHSRCDEEIAKMQDKQAKAREAAQHSVNSRKASAERRLAEQQAAAERTLGQTSTDVQLPTPTPTPTPTPIKEYSPALRVPSADAADDSKPLVAKDLIEEGVDPQVAADWLKVRKAKKAPLTRTAWDGVKREGEIAGMSPAQAVKYATECGWQGFKASWIGAKNGAGATRASGDDWTRGAS